MIKKLWAWVQGLFGYGPGALGPVYKSGADTQGPQFGDLVASQNLAGTLAPTSIVQSAHAAFPVLLRADSVFEIEARSYREASAHCKGLADEMVLTMNMAAKRVNGLRVYRKIGGLGMSAEEWSERSAIIAEMPTTQRGAKARGAATVASHLSGAPVVLTPEEAKNLLDAGAELRGKHLGAPRIRPAVAIAPHDMAARRALIEGNRNRGAQDFDVGITEEQLADPAFMAPCQVPKA